MRRALMSVAVAAGLLAVPTVANASELPSWYHPGEIGAHLTVNPFTTPDATYRTVNRHTCVHTTRWYCWGRAIGQHRNVNPYTGPDATNRTVNPAGPYLRPR